MKRQRAEGPVFIDTDVFLRFLVRDQEKQYERARRLFQKADEGRLKLQTSELVVSELVNTLQTEYSFSKEQTSEVLEAILSTRNLKVQNSSVIEAAVKLYARYSIGFVDAYNVALIKRKGTKMMATFDRRLFKECAEIESYD